MWTVYYHYHKESSFLKDQNKISYINFIFWTMYEIFETKTEIISSIILNATNSGNLKYEKDWN